MTLFWRNQTIHIGWLRIWSGGINLTSDIDFAAAVQSFISTIFIVSGKVEYIGYCIFGMKILYFC